MAEIIFRTIRDEDIPGVNTFYNNYHHAGRTMDKFKWEFQDGPHGQAIYCLALVAETGQIIGIQAGIPILCLTAKNETLLTIKSEDTLVDVDLCASLKKKKLFSELYAFFVAQCVERGAVCIWGFTWAKKSFIRLGFQIPFDAEQGLLVIQPSKSFHHLSGLNVKNTLFDKLKIGVLVATSWISGWKGRYRSTIAGITVREGICSNENLVLGMTRTSDDLVFMKQDSAFQDWRLKNNPYPLNYTVLNFFQKETLAAQIIVSLHSGGQGYLEQLLLAPGHPAGFGKKIIRSAIKHLSCQGAFHIRAMTFSGNQLNHQQAGLLKSTGFFPIKKGMGFVFLPLNNPPDFSADQFFLSRINTQGHN